MSAASDVDRTSHDGVLRALHGLHPPSMGARIAFAGGKPTVTEGASYGREVIGGYWSIEVNSKQEEAAAGIREMQPRPGA
jgi:hypothetical protein